MPKSLVQSVAVWNRVCHLPVTQNFAHAWKSGRPENENKNKSAKIKSDVFFSAATHFRFSPKKAITARDFVHVFRQSKLAFVHVFRQSKLAQPEKAAPSKQTIAFPPTLGSERARQEKTAHFILRFHYTPPNMQWTSVFTLT
jgi:hypothetical protein